MAPTAPQRTIVVVGGNAAGLAAASRAKRSDPTARVIVFEAGPTPSVSNCNFSYVLSGKLDGPSRVVAHPPGYFTARGLELELESPVVEVRSTERRLRVEPRGGAAYEAAYDRLVYCAGALARRLEVPGRDEGGVHALHSYTDFTALHADLDGRDPERMIVVGGGFKALSVGAALSRRFAVSLVCVEPRPLPGLAPELWAVLEEHLAGLGVDVHAGRNPAGYLHDRSGRLVGLEADGATIPGGFALELIGVLPNTAPLGAAFELDRRSGAVVVDTRQATSLDGVYAAGDCAVAHHALLPGRHHLPNGALANRAGRVAGANAAGGSRRSAPALGTRATELYGLELSRTGLGLEEARAAGYDARRVYVKVLNHATFHLPRTHLHCSAVFEEGSGRLLGVQLVGPSGANHRINAAAAAVTAGMSVSEAAGLDFAYHPHSSPVWDPLLVLFRAAQRRLEEGP